MIVWRSRALGCGHACQCALAMFHLRQYAASRVARITAKCVTEAAASFSHAVDGIATSAPQLGIKNVFKRYWWLWWFALHCQIPLRFVFCRAANHQERQIASFIIAASPLPSSDDNRRAINNIGIHIINHVGCEGTLHRGAASHDRRYSRPYCGSTTAYFTCQRVRASRYPSHAVARRPAAALLCVWGISFPRSSISR